jgi:hypothetical protein
MRVAVRFRCILTKNAKDGRFRLRPDHDSQHSPVCGLEAILAATGQPFWRSRGRAHGGRVRGYPAPTLGNDRTRGSTHLDELIAHRSQSPASLMIDRGIYFSTTVIHERRIRLSQHSWHSCYGMNIESSEIKALALWGGRVLLRRSPSDGCTWKIPKLRRMVSPAFRRCYLNVVTSTFNQLSGLSKR